MSKKLNFNFLEEVQTRTQLALATNNGAAVRGDTTNEQEYSQDISNGKNTYPISPYYNDVESEGSFKTWNPVVEFERFQGPVFRLLSDPDHAENYQHAKAARLFDFDYWLEVNRKHTAGFERAELFGVKDLQKNLIFKLADLYKRYAAHALELGKKGLMIDVVALVPDLSKNSENADLVVVQKMEQPVKVEFTEYCFSKRINALYWWLWYSVLGLQVEKVREFDHWIEMMECSCCPLHLENVSICIQTIGGHRVEDRDSFLAKLRPHFQNHTSRLSGKTITCDCAEGLNQ